MEGLFPTGEGAGYAGEMKLFFDCSLARKHEE